MRNSKSVGEKEMGKWKIPMSYMIYKQRGVRNLTKEARKGWLVEFDLGLER